MKTVNIETLKKGDYFRKPNTKKVYVANGYCRINRKYEAFASDDISDYIYLKKGKQVETDFDY